MTSGRPTAVVSRQHAIGFGCVVLFLLPFAAAGILAGAQAARAALANDWGEAGFLSIFALVFGGVGIGGLVATLIGHRKAAEATTLETRHPTQPWLWRADWAAGRIEDSNRATMWTAWCFAALWNLISLPSAVLAVRSALNQGNHAAWVALLFPMVGIGLLVWATRATIRYRRFGVSRLDLSTRPGVIGRSLAGTVQLTTALQPPQGFQVLLSCVRRVTRGGGKNRSTTETLLWQEERREPGRVSRLASGMGTVIPVAFALPPDAQPCDSANPGDRVLWRLELAGSVPGVDYHSSFEVPVFRTGESTEPADESVAQSPSVPADYKQPPESRIQVVTNRRGTEILFPAARNPGVAAGLTGFLLLWAGIIVGLLLFDAPLFFPIVFGAFGVLLLFGALDAWLGVTRVTAGDGRVTLARGWIAPSRERTFSAAEVNGVRTRIGMQAGGRPYYDLRLVRVGGKEVAAGRGIRDKREAEWLAATLEQAIKS
jgi:hypothetical protein